MLANLCRPPQNFARGLRIIRSSSSGETGRQLRDDEVLATGVAAIYSRTSPNSQNACTSIPDGYAYVHTCANNMLKAFFDTHTHSVQRKTMTRPAMCLSHSTAAVPAPEPDEPRIPCECWPRIAVLPLWYVRFALVKYSVCHSATCLPSSTLPPISARGNPSAASRIWVSQSSYIPIGLLSSWCRSPKLCNDNFNTRLLPFLTYTMCRLLARAPKYCYG